MQLLSSVRLIRLLTIIFPTVLFLAGCGTGDGKQSIPGNPAPPPPPPPPANCADTIGFEDACGPFTFTDFAGGAVSIIDNPEVGGINTTAKVAQMQKFADQVFGGSTLTLDTPPDFSAGEFFKLRVRSSRAVPVLFKFEGLDKERELSHSGSGTWEELCFDFSNDTTGPAPTGITFIFDLGTNGDAGNDPDNWTFQFDEIEQDTSCAGGPPLALVFEDNFDTNGAPDPAKWNLETGYGPNNDGWGNNEWQNYTNASENVRVENGNLVIQALCPSGTCGVRDGSVTSARINTKDKFEFRYGRIEARIQFPTGPAVWPAFWMLGANLDTVGWPNAGEVDVAEVFNTNSDGNTVHGSMFWCDDSLTAPNPCSDANGGRASSTDTFRNSELLSNDFHVYSAEWNEDQITIQFDGQTYFTRTIDPATMEEFRERFFLLLNVAMGGSAGSANQPPNGSEVFPQTMLVDYVRVFSADSGPSTGEDTVIDFEDAPANYDFGMDGGFGGGASGVIANPQMSGINMSAQVAQMQKFAGEVFGGSTLALPAPLEITEAGNATMKVWSPRPVNVLLKFEGPVEAEFEVAHGGSGWEELTFNFSSFTGTVTGLTFIFDLGTVGNADNDPANWTFYYDDIVIPTGTSGGGGGGDFAPVTFDDPAVTYALRGFGGAEDSTVIADPTDAANNVVQVNRTDTAETFAGTVVSTGPNESVGAIPLDAANTTMNIRVYSPAAGIPVRLKIENSGDPAISVETEATTTAANTWETLTFDFANEVAGTAAFNPAATYDKTVIFFNFGTDGATAGAQTFLFDDIDVGPGGGGGGGGFSPVTFDDPALTYALRGFGGAEDSTVVVDPTDAANNVAQVNRTDAAETFAGTVVSTGPNESIDVIPLDAANTTMTVRVYSPAAGVPVRLKIENSGDPAISVETEATTTAVNTWEELTFDFANEAAGTAAFNPASTYDKVVIFFNFGTDGATAGAQTFLFDDIDVGTGGGGGGGGGMTSTDFESGSATFADFGGAVAAVIANPDASGLNTSNFVGQMQKFAGEVFAGSTLDLGGTVPLAAGDSYTMLVRAQRAVPVTLKLEPQGDERVANYSGSGTWELLCFDFSGVSGDVTGLTIIFDNGTAGDAAGDPNNWTFQFDDIQQTSDSCGGGGGGGSFAPITFDDPAITYTLRGFGGAEDSTVVQDPTDAGNNVVQVNRSAAAETFAGTVVSTLPNEAIGAIPLDAANTTMNVRVYSPAAGIPVRLKIENSGDPAISVETEATTTAANTWEELTFDFANEAAGTAAFNPAATYDKAVIFFNFGTNGATAGAQTFLFDDIDVGPGSGGGGGGSGTSLDFEDDPATYDFGAGPGVPGGFGGGQADVIANPDQSGINTSAQVGRMQKFMGEVFGGATLMLASPLDIPASSEVKMKVWAQRSVPVLFKLEGGPVAEVSVTHSGSGWEELTFDFSSVSGSITGITLIFDLGVNGDAAGDPNNWIFYFDDITVGPAGGGGGGGGSFAPITFDDPAITYALRGFGGAEDSTVIQDPTDAGNNVVQVNRSAAAETFAGTVVSTGPNESIPVIPLDAANTTMNVRVYSPAAGIPVRLKIENSNDPGVSVETEATTTAVNTWEELTFDFANEAAGTAAFNPAATYDKAVIFFNFGTNGATAGAQTFLFDDIDVGPGSGGGGGGGGGMTSSDFESGSATFNDFGGAVAAVISNPDVSGLNTSTFVGQMQKFAGEVFAGSTLDLGGSVALAAGDSYTMLVRAQRAVAVTFKLEPQGDERVANYSGSGTWELLCFDFAGVSGDVTGITIIFDNGTAGDAAGDPNNWTFQFDDIQQTTDSCSGGGGGSFTPITFDDPAVTYALRGFGGAEDSTVIQDPTDAANNVVQVNRSATAETFAGTVVSTGPNESIDVIPLDAANTTMNVRVYSPAAGIPVRFKIENSANGAISVETEATTTAANTWEELTFDFANQAAGTAAFDPAATYDKAVIFFNFGTNGATAGAQTFLFDDIDVGPGSGGGGGGGATYDPITFDDPAITYTLRGFGGAEDSTVIQDPTDAANNVAQINRSAAAETFAGTVVSTLPNEAIPVIPLDAANTTMNVRVYSPAAGIVVRLKIENSANGAISVETEATTTAANTWEELTFDFANQAAGTAAFDPAATYDKAVIFFNFGTNGATAGAQTFLFDDIDVGPGSGGGGGGGGSASFTNGDFETGDFTGWTETQIPDTLGSIAIDSSGQGGRAGFVARLTATGSDVIGTNDVLIEQVALGAGTISPGDSIDVSFDLFGSLTGAGGVVFVEVIFLDAAGGDNGRNFVGPAAPYTPTSMWTTHAGTVTAGTTVGGGSASVEGGVTLSLKVACGAIVGGCGVDASFDNVTFTIN